MDINDLSQQFKTLKEMRHYALSQTIVINELNKKIVTLEEENNHLKKLLENSTPLLDNSTGQLEMYKEVSDEMAVCIMQIKLLKDQSLDGELDFEKAKKLDIYTKLLLQLNEGKKAKLPAASKLSDEELATLLNSEINNNNGK